MIFCNISPQGLSFSLRVYRLFSIFYTKLEMLQQVLQEMLQRI